MTGTRKRIAIAAAVISTVFALSLNAFGAIETIQYSYDEQGRIQTVDYGNGLEDTYVYDIIGNRNSKTLSVNGGTTNQPPYAPQSPLPADGAASVQPAVQFQWTGGDPNSADVVTYAVYLGTTTNPPLYRNGISATSLDAGTLKPNTTYYWKVVAKDNYNATAESALWSLTTGNQAPSTPSDPVPRDNSLIVNQQVYLSWSASDPDVTDQLQFDVYFGDSPSPPLIAQDLTTPNLDVDDLLPAGTYYWKVVAKDPAGSTAESAVWSFQAVDNEPVVYNGATISADTVFSRQDGPYLISGAFTVAQGVTLTIEPGTIIKMDANASITVRGTLIAQGTESLKIVFTSYRDDSYGGDTNGDWNGSSPDKGDWYYLSFFSGSVNCTLSHVRVRYAGVSASTAAVSTNSADITFANVTIEESAGHGIQIGAGSATITDATIARCDRRGVDASGGEVEITGTDFIDNNDYDIYTSRTTTIQGNTIRHGIYVANTTSAVQITGNLIHYDNLFPLQLPADSVGTVQTENTITDTNSDSPLIVLGQTITHDAIWPDTFRYLVDSIVTIQGVDGEDQLTTLSLSQGVNLRFKSGASLKVGGSYGDPGALIAEGTLQRPVRFGASQVAGIDDYWNGIRFDNTASDTTTRMQYCMVENVGNNSNMKAIDISSSSPAISQCAIRNSQGTGIYISGGSPQISASSISGCSKYGIQIVSGTAQIDGNTFNYNGNYDLYMNNGTGSSVDNNTVHSGLFVAAGQLASLDGNTIHYNSVFPVRLIADDIGVLLSDNTVTDIAPDSYLEVISGTIGRDAFWPASFAYHVLGNVTIKGRDGADSITTLTVEAGTVLRFANYTNLYIGGTSGDPGALVANGTAQNPIQFTSMQSTPAAGDWSGMTFYATTDDATTRLAHCIIEYAGYGTAGRAIYIYNASPTITGCIIRYSQGDGIYTLLGAPQIIASTISDCGRYAINVSSGAPVISANTFATIGSYDLYMSNGNGATVTDNALSRGLYVSNGVLAQVSGNSLAYNEYYPLRLNADDVGVFLNSNTLTNLTADSYLEVVTGTVSRDALWPASITYHILGNITIKGSDGTDGVTTLTLDPGAEIRFNRYSSLTVGYYSGDPGALVAEGTADHPILFTSNVNPPAAGNWNGIVFLATSHDATTTLTHCIVEYAGYYTSGKAIQITNASPTLENCTLRYSQGYGIRVDGGSPEISKSTITGCVTGIYISSGTPIIYTNQLTGNSSYGLRKNAAPTIIAQENWWGHLTGPYHATTNPDGQGDTVSDYVDYDPWVVDPDDMDGDAIPDQWEIDYFDTIDTIDETTDVDADGLSDSDEYTHNTDPTDPDTDDDGTSDGDEVAAGTDPLDPMSH